jgi:single-strand DNA-binding protein
VRNVRVELYNYFLAFPALKSKEIMFRARLIRKTFTDAVRWMSDMGGESSSGDHVSLKGARAVLTGERGINRVTLLGRVGQDPQQRGNPENLGTIFPLATSFSLKTRDGQYVQRTEWHRITVFRPVLRDLVAQFVKKGDRVYVTGTISYVQYKDKNNLTQRAASILADDVLNMSRTMHGGGSTAVDTEEMEMDSESADSLQFPKK